MFFPIQMLQDVFDTEFGMEMSHHYEEMSWSILNDELKDDLVTATKNCMIACRLRVPGRREILKGN